MGLFLQTRYNVRYGRTRHLPPNLEIGDRVGVIARGNQDLPSLKLDYYDGIIRGRYPLLFYELANERDISKACIMLDGFGSADEKLIVVDYNGIKSITRNGKGEVANGDITGALKSVNSFGDVAYTAQAKEYVSGTVQEIKREIQLIHRIEEMLRLQDRIPFGLEVLAQQN